MRQSAAKPFIRERSTTIESITIEKYYSEEVSRVGEIRSGSLYNYGNSNYIEDIVYQDILNILHIINYPFYKRCNMIFNPRNAMYISRIDGKLNSYLLVQRDTLINANTFLYLGRKNYTEAQINAINAAKERQKAYYLEDDI